MAKKIKSRKVTSNGNDGFTETIKFKVLHCGNVEGNNNKFYCLELQKDSSDNFRLFSHYGRLGTSNIYEVRDDYDGSPITNQSIAESEFDAIIKKKEKGKKKKEKDGTERWEKYEIVETVKPTVGSENICNQSVGVVKVSQKIKIDSSTVSSDPQVIRIIDQVVKENIHNITSNTALKFTSNGFETPLGPVTQEHIAKARGPLDAMKSRLRKGKLDPNSQTVRESNTLYYSLIPHQFGSKITQSDWILDDGGLVTEYDLLDQLESAIQMGSALNQGAQQKLNALGSDIELLKDKKEKDRIAQYLRKTRASNHRSIWGYDIKNIFKIKIPKERKRFETSGKTIGNVKELFHGSRNCNILSILKNGLIIPPCSAPGVTGRMFGDGLYAAHNSTKALNYSIGFWSRTKNKFSNAFLFLVDFAMGKEHKVKSSLYNGAPRGYDSVHAVKGHSLYNDEYIVYNLKQATLTHLIELED